VSAFCNLAVSLTTSRLPECFHEADEETLARFGQHWFINIGGELANNAISHPVSTFFENLLPTKKQAAGASAWEESWRDISCLTGGKLEENPDFSLRRVTFR